MKIWINTIGKKNINDLLKFDIIVPIEFKKKVNIDTYSNILTSYQRSICYPNWFYYDSWTKVTVKVSIC